MDKQTIIINGDNFSDLESFYNEIDRVLTKDLGWDTGHNLDAFNDLLRGGFGVYEYEEPIKLTWKNILKSKSDLGLEATKKWYELKIAENKIENKQFFKDKLKELTENNGQTLFDIILEIISEHKHIEFETQHLMSEQRIKISLLAIDEGDDTIQFQMELTNAVNSTSIDFYGYADEFQDFANDLCSFPKNIDSEIKYELGEQGQKWAYYILLRVFCHEKNGHTAIQIKIDNNRIEPYKSYSEFYIMTVPASINKLGQKLKNWNPKTEKEIEWTAE